ncbi:MAG: HD domain-containing protein [Bacillota bacterium]|nr:HD domain-containing protein [Bacillota bacterium]
MKKMIESIEEALKLLNELNAPEKLTFHGKLVCEAAEDIIKELSTLDISLDFVFIRIATILHDIGKIIHISELSMPGHFHEEEGEKILIKLGIDPNLARCCLSHARYNNMNCSIEELIVALADKLWKGKRDETLELKVVDAIAERLGKERWNIFMKLDDCFESVAMKGNERLNRSLN